MVNFVAVALVSSFVRQKLQIRWLALVILGLIAIYPLTTQYRFIVRRNMNDSITSVNAASEAVQGAAEQSGRHEGSAGTYMLSGWSASVQRLNYLQSVALLLAYRDRSYQLEGDERLWMIPFYPFVPALSLAWQAHPGHWCPLHEAPGRRSK